MRKRSGMTPGPDPRDPDSRLRRSVAPAALFIVFASCAAASSPPRAPAPEGGGATQPAVASPVSAADSLARGVVVRRTRFGVPHIRAESLRAAYYALGYLQLEDYGERIPRGLVSARGERGLHFGRDSIDGDFRARRRLARAREAYHLLPRDVRDVYEGFAAGVNRYVELHPDEFPGWEPPRFTGHDVAARGIGWASRRSARRFLRRLEEEPDSARSAGGDGRGREAGGAPVLPGEPGSNAWALAPSRTTSGNAILLRNPHLSWDAGYYEAHIRVPGVLDFYGDFRIGGPFGIIGGFNRRLGWATTNNGPDTDEIYALEADPRRPDRVLFDGASVPLERVEVTVEYRYGDGTGSETRQFWETPLGPVIHREEGTVYVLRSAGHREHRLGEQFLRMMQASTLDEWKAAMRIRARTASNFTYADAEGNIFYVWNGGVPDLPHPSGGDTAAVPAGGSDDVWTRYVPFDSLPQLENPEGGYLHNENDPFHFTNLNEVLDPARYPASFPEPRLRLRSQHSLELVHGTGAWSLEDVVERKHSMRMLLADRVKDPLVEAVRRAGPDGDIAAAVELLASWDNTVARKSRGGVLFRTWWERYLATADTADDTPASAGFDATPGSLFREAWGPDRPVETPRGLADPGRAVQAFRWAVEETERRFGSWDVAWGEVHRVRHGDVDAPVGGCSGSLGCFRVLWYDEEDDGKLRVRGGDGWVLAVEFADPPRAYSILAYGQSDREGAPHDDDQAALFARNEMKPVAYTEEEIEAALLRSYRPGLDDVDGGR